MKLQAFSLIFFQAKPLANERKERERERVLLIVQLLMTRLWCVEDAVFHNLNNKKQWSCNVGTGNCAGRGGGGGGEVGETLM